MRAISIKTKNICTVFLLPLLLSCGLIKVVPPDVKITDEKTALENQILGAYNEIEEDVWMVASVRSSVNDKKIELSEEKESVLRAYQNIEFNKDDIDEFKRDKCIGENRRGLLEILGSERYETDEKYKLLVQQKVEEDNINRKSIMNRMIEVNHNLSKDNMNEVEKIFADIYRKNVLPGEFYQSDEGKWIKK